MRNWVIGSSAAAWALGLALWTLQWGSALAPQAGYATAPLAGLFVLPAALLGVVAGGLLGGALLARPAEFDASAPLAAGAG